AARRVRDDSEANGLYRVLTAFAESVAACFESPKRPIDRGKLRVGGATDLIDNLVVLGLADAIGRIRTQRFGRAALVGTHALEPLAQLLTARRETLADGLEAVGIHGGIHVEILRCWRAARPRDCILMSQRPRDSVVRP